MTDTPSTRPMRLRALVGSIKKMRVNLPAGLHLCVVFTMAILSVAGCEMSNQAKASKTSTVSNSAFGKGLDAIVADTGATLVLVSYWNGWQAILRDSQSGKYLAYRWDGSSFTRLSRSALVRKDLCREVYDHLEPLEQNHRLASVDYSQALESTKSRRRMSKMFYSFPMPCLVGISQDGRVRPIWVLPYRLYPSEGPIGVFADSGEILKSVKFDRGGLRERRWWE
jgi:hypothetical protein